MKIQIGQIGVDAGLCWIGDPCYILHREEKPKDIGKDWRDFVNKLYSDTDFGNTAYKYTQFNHDMGHPGLGVCVQSGYGDGLYPVYADIDDGVVKKVWVEFVSDEESED